MGVIAAKEHLQLDPTDTHRQIVIDCQSGHAPSQEKLYRLYAKAMYNICIRMLGNEHDAEDLLQHSFIDVFTKLHTFRFESSIGAWIKRIVVNNCINYLKKKRLVVEPLEENHHLNNRVLYCSGNNPVPEPMYTINDIKKAMMNLPTGFRVVFTLYALEGYDHKEIGQILGVSETTSKSQYSRAKQKLKKIIQKEHA